MRVKWLWDEVMVVALFVEDGGRKELRESSDANYQAREILYAGNLHQQSMSERYGRTPASIKRKSADYITASPQYSGRTTKGGRLTASVAQYWSEDPAAARADAKAIIELIEDGSYSLVEHFLADQWEAREGLAMLARHVRRERNPRLRARKIEASGDLDCEVCGLNFNKMYGARGRRYIEVHHIVPLHVSGLTITKLDDLALLCANCHRMVHRRPWTTPAALRSEVQFDFYDVVPGRRAVVDLDDDAMRG